MTDNSHQLEEINPHTGEPYSVRPNKTQLKREMKALHQLGKTLVALAPSRFPEVTLSNRMRDAILEAKRLKKSALQRQLRFIASIMHEEDVELIQRQLKQIALPQQQETEKFHQLETWRDALLSGDNQLMNELVDTLQADRQHLRQLVRNANKEAQQNKPPKAARLLFQYLKTLQDETSA